MDPTAKFQKSPAGSEALATRHPALTPKLRSLLILVDGKRSRSELVQLGQALGDGELLLAQLVQLGYIHAQSDAAGGARQPAAEAAGQAAAPGVPLVQAQRTAVRKLTDLLGPAAEELCLRIEATRSSQEFAAAIARAEGTLRKFANAELANQFAADMAHQRPA